MANGKLEACGSFDGALLRVAIEGGSTAKLRELLDGGAPVDERYFHGQTALIVAAAYGHLEVVKLLLERGADHNATDMDGHDAMEYAEGRGFTEVTDWIYRHSYPHRDTWATAMAEGRLEDDSLPLIGMGHAYMEMVKTGKAQDIVLRGLLDDPKYYCQFMETAIQALGGDRAAVERSVVRLSKGDDSVNIFTYEGVEYIGWERRRKDYWEDAKKGINPFEAKGHTEPL